MAKQKRFLAVLVALAVCFVMVFSVFYIAAESGHSCTHEHCAVCAMISVCSCLLKTISACALAALIVLSLIYTLLFAKKELPNTAKRHTLIALKTKLTA